MATPTPEELAERLGRMLDVADDVRRSELASFVEVESRRGDALAFERARLAGRGAEPARLERIDRHAEEARRRAVELRADLDTTLVAPPEPPDEDTVVVRGRVVDREGGGVEGLTVTARDKGGADLGATDTDSLGYYEIRLPAREAKGVRLEGKRKRTVVFTEERPGRLPAGETIWRDIALEED